MSGMCPDSQSAQLPDSKVYLSLSLSLGWSPATAVLQLPFQSLVKNESRQRVQFNSGSVGCSTQAGLSNSTVTEVTLSLYACMYFLSLSLSLASLAVNQPSHTDTRLVKTEMCVHVYEYVYIYIYTHIGVCVCVTLGVIGMLLHSLLFYRRGMPGISMVGIQRRHHGFPVI